MSFFNNLGAAFAGRWIAGVSVEDAIEESGRINKVHEEVMVNYLGEHFESMQEVENAVSTYIDLLDGMKDRGIEGCIAVKATQLGMGVDERECYKNYVRIARYAKSRGFFVWLDMEESYYTSDTISLYLKALKGNSNIGICLQARLKRSYADARRIVRMHGRIRLVKGAYEEPGRIMYTDREDVFENYMAIMKYLFQKSDGFIIASHDEKLIESAMKLGRIYRKRFSFAMLKGIRGNLARKIAAQGNRIFIYVPFGADWLAYSARRLREGTNMALVLRSIFQQ